MTDDRFFASLDSYFERSLAAHGATARGVDWNSEGSQELRFRELLGVVDRSAPYSINDYGCGYGALAHFLAARGDSFTYSGLDVSERMLALARENSPLPHEWTFVAREEDLPVADYTVASGLFNLRLEVHDDAWTDYVRSTIRSLAALSRRAFSFNMLTSYSDPPLMRPELFYGDPSVFFDFCRREISRHVALHHDYGLYEWTIHVRTDPREPAG
jgi:SAM-dependent methyltransferase